MSRVLQEFVENIETTAVLQPIRRMSSTEVAACKSLCVALGKMPHDVIVNIMSRLGLRHIAAISGSCRRFRDAARCALGDRKNASAIMDDYETWRHEEEQHRRMLDDKHGNKYVDKYRVSISV